MNLRRTLTIAAMTVEENIRKRIIYILFFISLILVGTSSLLNTFGLGAQETIIKDLSLSGISFFGIIFTISLFLNVIPGEIEQRTIYPLLAQPITRADYLWGKFLGIFSIVTLYLLVLGIELMVVLLPHTEHLQFSIMQAVLLIIIQCGIIGTMIILCSLLMSYPLTISTTLFIYIVGNLSVVYIDYLFTKSSLIIAKLVIFIKLFIPKFDLLDIKNAVVHGYVVSNGYLLSSILYGLLFIVVIMLLAEIVFERKDL